MQVFVFFGSSSLKHFVLYNMDKTTMIAGFPMLGLNTLQIEPLEGVGQTSGGLKKNTWNVLANMNPTHGLSLIDRSIYLLHLCFLGLVCGGIGSYHGCLGIPDGSLPEKRWSQARSHVGHTVSMSLIRVAVNHLVHTRRSNNISSFHQLMIVQFLVWSEL